MRSLMIPLIRSWAGLLMLGAVLGWAGDLRLVREPGPDSVPQFGRVEWRIEAPGTYANPFDPREVTVDLEVSRGTNRVRVPAFWMQDYEVRSPGPGDRRRTWMYPAGQPHWRVRFSPVQPGTHEARIVLRDRSGTNHSAPVRFECVPSTNRGFLRVSPKDPRFLETSDGRPFFGIGQNLAFIGEQQYVTLARAGQIFHKLAANGANYLRVWTGCEDWALAIEARKSAWGRSWDWHPPLVPLSGAEDPDTRCLQLSRSAAMLKVNPSHEVALRPSTRYVVTGRMRTTVGAVLQLSVLRGAKTELGKASGEEWQPLRHEFETSADDSWLTDMFFQLEGEGMAWLADLSLREAGGGPELLWEADVNRPARGFYNPLDCFMLDRLVALAEQEGIRLQLCLTARDVYMSSLKDPADAAYTQAIADARNLLRYAVARWGASTSIAAWEYWNELDPGLPTDRFYTELGDYLEQSDPYRHLRTTSTWGPSAKDCRHPGLDLSDTHFYLRPGDRPRLLDEVEAVLDRTRWLREQSPRKPVHLGEFGLANEKWQPTAEMQSSREFLDFHNGLWASAMSGAATTALFWWWDRLDPLNPYPAYQPLSTFLADVPWNGGALESFSEVLADGRVRLVGLRAGDQAWLWLFNRDAAWQRVVVEGHQPSDVRNLAVNLPGMKPGAARVKWWDTRTGRVLQVDQLTAGVNGLRLAAPIFSRDIACQVSR